MATIRRLQAANGTDTHELEIFTFNGRVWLWDRTADPHCDSATQIADSSDTAVMDAIRDSGFEIVTVDEVAQ